MMPAGHHDEGQTCRCVQVHRPAPLELDHHHVWPLGMGGPDSDDNRVWLCPTAHANVHEILRLLMRFGPLSYHEVQVVHDRPVNRYAHQVASDGYRAWKEGTGWAHGSQTQM